MNQNSTQGFIIDGEDNFWSLNDQINDSKKFSWDLYDDGFTEEYYSVSSSFYEFMNGNSSSSGKSYLNQIELLTGIDLSTLDEMARYISSFETDEKSEMMESEAYHLYLKKVEQENKKLRGNIDKVIDSLNRLIPELEKIKDLSDKLNFIDAINSDYYRNLDKVESGVCDENNLAQDLRNILRYTLLAKSRGIETTFFIFR